MGDIAFQGGRAVPGKIICIGKNYLAHIDEMGSAIPEDMVVFMKPNSAITPTLRAHAGERLHYECEICLLIKGGDIAGVGVGLDLTKRSLQGKLKQAGLPWERSKAFDGSALFSRFVAPPDHLCDLAFELSVNNTLRQRGETGSMLYPPATIVQQLQSFLTLEDFDVIMTGTPAGVGPVTAGDEFEARLLEGESERVRAQWTAL